MKKKALLIDDSVTIHRVIDLSIDSEKFDISKVFSAEEAGLKLSGESFDFILLDNKLEGVSVADYVGKLKNMQPAARIILLVGAFDRFGETELKNSLADDYLIKPFDSQSLNLKLDGVDKTDSEAEDVYGTAEPDDSMPAGFVERIPEADMERENNNVGAVPVPVTGTCEAAAFKSSLEEDYLNSLEDVHPDDMLEEGYAEDARQLDDLSGIAEIPEPEVLAEEISVANTQEDARERAEFDSAELEETEFDGIGEVPAESVTEAPPIYEEKESSDISLQSADLNGALEVPEEFENAGLDALVDESEEIFSLENNVQLEEETESLSENIQAEVLPDTDSAGKEIQENKTEEISAEFLDDDLNPVRDGGVFPGHSDETGADGLEDKEYGRPEEFFQEGVGFDDTSTESEQIPPYSSPGAVATEKTARKDPGEPETNPSSFSMSISKAEIMSMIGAALDKKVLEQALRDAITLHMGEIVRSIVPELAEKYIKEEIERLKNDD